MEEFARKITVTSKTEKDLNYVFVISTLVTTQVYPTYHAKAPFKVDPLIAGKLKSLMENDDIVFEVDGYGECNYFNLTSTGEHTVEVSFLLHADSIDDHVPRTCEIGNYYEYI